MSVTSPNPGPAAPVKAWPLAALSALAGCDGPPVIQKGSDSPEPKPAVAEYVIQISVDGLRPRDMQTLIDAGEAPNFGRFQTEGSGTNDARVDQTKSLPFRLFGLEKLVQTPPNHMSMMTGRPVERNNHLGPQSRPRVHRQQ